MSDNIRKTMQRRRRRYLAARAAGHVSRGAGCIVAAASGIAALGFAFALLLLLISTLEAHAGDYNSRHDDSGVHLVLCGMTVLFTLLLGGLTYAGVGMVQSADKRMEAMEYVPPVSEQVASLPAEEILVRGSDEPAATAAELLRVPAGAGPSATGELLHPAGSSNASEPEKDPIIGGADTGPVNSV